MLDVVYQRKYVRASKAYREAILKWVGDRWEAGQMPPVKTGQKAPTNPPRFGWQAMGMTVLREGEFEVGGRVFKVEMETFGSGADFVKLRPDEHDAWAVYWRRGKGMKVYGPYDDFERDIVLLKAFNDV